MGKVDGEKDKGRVGQKGEIERGKCKCVICVCYNLLYMPCMSIYKCTHHLVTLPRAAFKEGQWSACIHPVPPPY